VIRNTIREYEMRESKGLPFTLVFFILPLILHHDTFKEIRANTPLKFFSWLNSRVSQTKDIEQRINNLKNTTTDAILFLLVFNTIKIHEGRLHTVDFDLSIKSREYNPYMRDYQNKAIQIGKWFSETGSISTIYSLLGVKP